MKHEQKPWSTQDHFYIPSHMGHLWEDLGFHLKWENFSFEELRSKGDGSLLIHYRTLSALQYLRTMLKRPIFVTSYYRDADYNRAVGGAEASYHLRGMAIDTQLYAGNLEGRAEMVYWASQAGFRGFGFYPTFNHIDFGPHRVWDET